MGRKTPRLWPKWTQSVGAMRDAGVRVQAHCGKCRNAFKVDLATICAMKGRGYSLIDKTTPCKLIGCGGTCFFLYSPSEGTPFRPLKSGP